MLWSTPPCGPWPSHVSCTPLHRVDFQGLKVTGLLHISTSVRGIIWWWVSCVLLFPVSCRKHVILAWMPIDNMELYVQHNAYGIELHKCVPIILYQWNPITCNCLSFHQNMHYLILLFYDLNHIIGLHIVPHVSSNPTKSSVSYTVIYLCCALSG